MLNPGASLPVLHLCEFADMVVTGSCIDRHEWAWDRRTTTQSSVVVGEATVGSLREYAYSDGDGWGDERTLSPAAFNERELVVVIKHTTVSGVESNNFQDTEFDEEGWYVLIWFGQNWPNEQDAAQRIQEGLIPLLREMGAANGMLVAAQTLIRSHIQRQFWYVPPPRDRY